MVLLGDEVRDVVSGFQGIAVSRHIYLQGCTRITIQPKVGKDGKLPEMQTFDEPLLIIVSKEKNGKGKGKNGGPSKWEDIRRY